MFNKFCDCKQYPSIAENALFVKWSIRSWYKPISAPCLQWGPKNPPADSTKGFNYFSYSFCQRLTADSSRDVTVCAWGEDKEKLKPKETTSWLSSLHLKNRQRRWTEYYMRTRLNRDSTIQKGFDASVVMSALGKSMDCSHKCLLCQERAPWRILCAQAFASPHTCRKGCREKFLKVVRTVQEKYHHQLL